MSALEKALEDYRKASKESWEVLEWAKQELNALSRASNRAANQLEKEARNLGGANGKIFSSSN